MQPETAITRYAKWVVNNPWAVIIISIALVAAAFSGGRHLSFTTDYRVFFSDTNPQLMAFDALEKMYTKNDNVMFVVTPKDGNVFSESTLKSVQQLTESGWQLPYSIRVDSITNYQHTEAEGDELTVRDLVPEDAQLTPQLLSKAKQVALSEPLLVRRLISETGHVTGINVTVQLPGKNPAAEVPEIVESARKAAAEIEAANPNIEIRLSGLVLLNNAFSENSKKDMSTLVPISFGLMMFTLGLLLKGFSGVAGTLLVILMSIMTALGLGGYIGFPITPPSASTPQIVLTVAIANSVHILVSFLHEMRAGLAKKDAMVESLRINLQPVFLASITTAIGFLTMNFADVPPFMHLGNMVAIGVVASFLLSVAFLPALMVLLPVRVKTKAGHDGNEMMQEFGGFVVRQRRRLFWGMLVLVGILISMIPRNELNDIFVNYFDTSVEFRRDADYFTENLGGLYVIDYSLDAGEQGGISNPDFLADVEKFSQWYKQQPETVHVNSITEIMKRLNKNMHGDSVEYHRLPEHRDLSAQYLLLYEMSLPYGLDLNNQINIDKSATRLTITIKTISTNNMLELEQRAAAWLEQNTTAIKQADATGPSIMFAHIGKRNIVSMLVGTTLALILISFILILALRSFKIGIISLIPNLIPAAMGFGLWGMLVSEVGLALSVVTSMTLGIVVDDTVHFLSKYLRATREKGYTASEAVRYAFGTVGMALLTTSIVLVVGFSVLALSAFLLNSGMGTLSAIVIAFALIADFFLLPPLLIKFEEKNRETQQADNNNTASATA